MGLFTRKAKVQVLPRGSSLDELPNADESGEEAAETADLGGQTNEFLQQVDESQDTQDELDRPTEDEHKDAEGELEDAEAHFEGQVGEGEEEEEQMEPDEEIVDDREDAPEMGTSKVGLNDDGDSISKEEVVRGSGESVFGLTDQATAVTDDAEPRFEQAVALAQEGGNAGTSFAVLAALTKGRDAMLAEMDESQLDELIVGHEQPKLRRTHMNPLLEKAQQARDSRKTFLRFCRERRGSGLRAWLLDLDMKGTNSVLYSDFIQNAMRVGLSLAESMLVWKAYRPSGKQTSLSFHEFDTLEWGNLNIFLELLWDHFNFDIDVVWSFLDKDGGGSVDVHEFCQSMQEIGFTGNAERIFYGLDSSGKGRMWKETMYYLFKLQPESHTRSKDSPLLKEFRAWVQENFDSAAVLCDKIGLVSAGSSFSIHTTAKKLEQLGFKGNCLHTVIAISKCNTFVHRHEIIDVMGAALPTRKESKSYAGRCMLTNRHKMDALAIMNMGKLDEKPEWNGGTYDPATYNKALGKRERHVFSGPFLRPQKAEVLSRLKKVEEPSGKNRKAKLSTGLVRNSR